MKRKQEPINHGYMLGALLDILSLTFAAVALVLLYYS